MGPLRRMGRGARLLNDDALFESCNGDCCHWRIVMWIVGYLTVLGIYGFALVLGAHVFRVL